MAAGSLTALPHHTSDNEPERKTSFHSETFLSSSAVSLAWSSSSSEELLASAMETLCRRSVAFKPWQHGTFGQGSMLIFLRLLSSFVDGTSLRIGHHCHLWNHFRSASRFPQPPQLSNITQIPCARGAPKAAYACMSQNANCQRDCFQPCSVPVVQNERTQNV